MNRKSALTFATVAISCFLLGWGVNEWAWITSLHRNPTLRTNVFFHMEKHGMDARMVQGNIIVNKGEFLCREWSEGISINIEMLAVGNITGLDKADTVLTDVYNDPGDTPQYPNSSTTGFVVADWTNGEDPAKNCTYKWTFEETVNLNAAAGYFSNTTYAFAIANFPGGAQTFNNGENLTVRFAYTFDAND